MMIPLSSKWTNLSSENLRMDDFIDRLSQIIEAEAGGKYSVFAKKAGIPHATFYKYTKGRMPHSEHLIKIHDVFGININWLLTGKGPLYIMEGSEDSEDNDFDLDLLGYTIGAVEAWLERNKRRLPPEKKAEVILYLYEECQERNAKPETATVERLLKLVA